jgi:integrase
MPRQHAPRRIEQGIFRDGDHLVAVVRIGSHSAAERCTFPLGTDLRTIRAWRHQTQSDLLNAHPSSAGTGTLAGDVPRFLETIEAGRRRQDFAALLQHWIASPIGRMDRRDITAYDILQQRTVWLDQGVAIVTVNHRLRALRALTFALDGETLYPTIKYLKPPTRAPRAIPIQYIHWILDAIPDRGRAPRFGHPPAYSELKIRLRIIAWTGIPPIQLEKLRPQDVDLRAGRLHLPQRQKGKGSPAVWVDLLPAAQDAFLDYAKVGLWRKRYSRSSASKCWKSAIKRVTKMLEREALETGDRSDVDAFLYAIPPGCRPYDLRHSFATELYRVTGDIRAVAELCQHANLDTTKTYTGGAVSERAASAIAKVALAHKGPRPILRTGN